MQIFSCLLSFRSIFDFSGFMDSLSPGQRSFVDAPHRLLI